MAGQQSWIKILLTKLKTATGYVSLAHGIGDLETVSFAEVVEAVENLLK